MRRRFHVWIAAVLCAIVIFEIMGTAVGQAAGLSVNQPGNQTTGPTELVSRRTMFAKHYRDEKGQMVAEISDVPVHYKGADGEWKEIDNRLLPAARQGYAWENGQNAFRVAFAERNQDRPARIELGGHWVEWAYKGSGGGQGLASGNRLTYAGAFPGVDLRYQVLGSGVKEELVVTDDDSPAAYRLDLKSDLEIQPQGGGLRFVDPEGATVFVTPVPFAYDGAGASTQLELVHLKQDRYELRVDELWLRHPDRVFPIVLDPSIIVQPDALAGMETWISSTMPDLNYGGDAILRVGNNGSAKYRSLLKFNLTGIPLGASVTQASLTLRRTAGMGGTTPQEYALHELTREWLELEATWTKAKGTQSWVAAGGDFDAAVVDGYKSISAAPGNANNTAVTWDVTPQVSRAADTRNNMGFLLKSRYEDTAAVREIHFAGSDGLDPAIVPKLTIAYTEDETPPAVSLTVSSTVSGNAVNLTANVTDTGAGVDRVEFLVDGGVIQTVTNPPYSITLDSTKYPNGDHRIEVRGYDKAGNVGESSRTVLFADSFADDGQLPIRDPGISLRDGMVSLVASEQPVSPGGPSASSAKTADSYATNRMADGNTSTYWKSVGQESAVGMESVVLDLGSVTSVNRLAVTPLRQADNLLMRIEFLDANGKEIPASISNDWLKLNGNTISFGTVSARQMRLTFTNLTHDLLTGLYHANVAEVSPKYYWQDSTPSYNLYQLTEMERRTNITCTTYHTTSSNCSTSVTVNHTFGSGLGTYMGVDSCPSCNGNTGVGYVPGTSITHTFTFPDSSATTTSTTATDAEQSQGASRVPANLVCDVAELWSWDSWATGNTGHRFDPGPTETVAREFPSSRQTNWMGCWPFDGKTYRFYRTTQWTKWTHTLPEAQFYFYKYTWVPFYPSGTDPRSYSSTSPVYNESNAAANLTDGQRLTAWVSAPATARDTTAWVEIPFAPAAVNAVYVDPRFEGMSARLLLTNAGTQVAALDVSQLRKGTYGFATVTADKLRIELSNLQGADGKYHAALNDVRISRAIVASSGQAQSRPFTVNGAQTVTLETAEMVPTGTTIAYMLTFDEGGSVAVTPGVPVAVPAGATEATLEATLAGDGRQTPVLYRWSVTTEGTGQIVRFQNGDAAPGAEASVVTITSPSMLQSVTGSVTVTADSSASDTVKMEFYVDGVRQYTDTAAPWSWTWDASKVASGAHVLQAVALNSAGKVGGAQVAVLVPDGSLHSLRAEADTTSQTIRLSWAGATSGSYKVYRSRDQFATVEKTWTTTSTSLDDTDAKTNGLTYYYRVAAVDANGVEGRASLVRSAVAQAPEAGRDRLGLERFYPYANLPMNQTEAFLNLTNGNVTAEVTDLACPCPGLMLTVRRSYNSLPDASNDRPHWRWNHEITAVTDPADNSVLITNADGARYRFRLENGLYIRPVGVYIWLERVNGLLQARHKNGVTWGFDSSGRLARMWDRNGNQIQYTYDTNGRISQAADSTGRAVDYVYNGSGLLSKVIYGPANDRREVAYAYDASGALTRVTDLMGNVWTYLYDADGRLVGSLTPSGSLWSLSYLASGKVGAVSDPLTDTSAFGYGAGSTVVTDARGNAITFAYNATGQLTRRSQTATSYDSTTPVTLANEYGYDADYNVTSFKDPNGQTHTWIYNARGNPTTMTLPPAATGAPTAVTQLLYDDPANPDHPTEIRYPLDVVETTRFDASGNQVYWSQGKMGEPPLSTKQYSYYANGLRASEQDMWGGLRHYEYDQWGNLSRVLDPLGNVTTNQYDWFGSMTSATDPDRNLTNYQYDKLGRLLTQTFADGTKRNAFINGDGLVYKTVDNNGAVSQYTYDRAERLTAVTDPMGTTRYQYDPAGNQTATINQNGWKTTTVFDEAGRRKSASLTVTAPAAATYTTYWKYDPAGNLIRVKNPNANEVALEYDNLGRESAQITAPGVLNARQTTVYDLRGRRTATVDALWHKLSYTYDALDRLTAVNENLLSGAQFAVEIATGEVATHFSQTGATLALDTTRAANGTRSLKVTASGTAVGQGVTAKVPVRVSKGATLSGKVQLSGSGRVQVRLRDRRNGTVASSPTITLSTAWVETVPVAMTVAADSDDFVLEVVTAETAQAVTFYADALEVSQRTAYQFSPASASVATLPTTYSVTTVDVVGQSSTTKYDLLGRVVEETDPLGSSERYTYHDGERRMTRTDAMGRATNFRYDERGRLSLVSYPDGSGVHFTYDGNGNRLTMSDSLGQTSVTYDAADRPTRVTDPFGRSVSYRYTGVMLTEITTKHGTTTYAYNEAGLPLRMTVVNEQNQSETVNFRFDGVGHLLEQTAGSQKTVWTYDRSERLTNIQGTYNASQRYNVGYEYDLVGNRTKYTRENNEVHNYTYDSLYRLTKATDSTSSYRTYDYDGAGNRLRRTQYTSGNVTWDEQYAHDNASRLVSMTRTEGSKTQNTQYEYDANGNQTRVTGPSGSTTFVYDFENRLLEQQFPDGARVTHRYDGAGQRLYTRDKTQETYRLYDRGQIVSEEDGAFATLASYRRDPTGRLVLTQQRTGTYYFQSDGLGSIIGLTKTDGTWDTTYAYDEFGVVSAAKGTAWNNFQYTGAPYDPASGLYHLMARDYNPEIGRFLTRDSYQGSAWTPWTQNRYTYVGNNPVNYIDPTGHFVFVIPLVVVGGAAVVDALIFVAGSAVAIGAGVAIGNEISERRENTKAPVVPISIPITDATTTTAEPDNPCKNGVTAILPYDAAPETAQHILDAQAAGHPIVLTLDKDQANARRRRRAATSVLPRTPIADRDEYPMATFFEGGAGASVRYVTPLDNQTAGGILGAQWRHCQTGTKVTIVVVKVDSSPRHNYPEE